MTKYFYTSFKKIIKTSILCFTSTLYFSQLKIVPSVGTSYLHSRMTSEEQDAIFQETFTNNITASLSLEKQLTKFDLGLNMSLSNAVISLSYNDTYDPFNQSGGLHTNYYPQNSLGLYTNYHLKDIGLVEVKNLTHTKYINKLNGKLRHYHRILRIKPTLGLFLSHIPSGNHDYNTNNLKLIESSQQNWGVNLQMGVRFQVRNQNKDRLQLALLYEQGFTNRVEEKYHKTTQNITAREEISSTGTFASRGSYFSIMVSYPITIINKKGERRKDIK